MKRNNLVKLVCLAFAAFFIRAIPHLFIIPYVGIGEGYMFIFAERLSRGLYFSLNQYPHTAILGVVVLHKLTRLPIITCGSFWSPLMSGLSAVVMYFVLRDLMGVKKPFLPTLLFVCLDSHIYRSTLFTSAAEATGILFLLIFVWVYSTKSKFSSVFLLPVLLWTHLIPFGIAIIFIFSDVVNNINQKGKIYAIIGVGIISIVAFLIFNPYGLFFGHIQFATDFFSADILSKINVEDVFLLFSTFLGTIIMFGMCLVLSERRGPVLVPSVLVALLGVLSLFWYSTMVSPFRVIVYAGMLGVMGYSKIAETRDINPRFTILLLILMLAQVSCFGWRNHNRVFDVVTHDEYDMIKWLKGSDPKVWYGHIYWDNSGDDLLVLLLIPIKVNPGIDENILPNKWLYTPELVDSTEGNVDNNTEGYVVNTTTGGYPRFKYVIYSDRFANRALFRFIERGNRIIYGRYPIADTWANDPNWEVVYENPGGKIYKRSDHEP